MAYLGNVPAEKYISFERQVFTIVNSQTAYTLSHSVTNENDIRLVVNNIVQEPGSGKAYTASGTTLTLSAALTNGTDEMYCVFLGRAVGTVNAPAGSVAASQLASDSVTAAKLNDDIISGQTELAAEPADTDEFLISDAGTLKRIDYSHIKGGGLTMADQWRLTASITGTNADITANLEQVDTTGQGTLGSAMSVSSGVFTFPSTGIYLVLANPWFSNGSDSDAQSGLSILVTTNNSSYSTVASAAAANQSGSPVNFTCPTSSLIDVTDTSNVKVKFATFSMAGTSSVFGDTSNVNYTHFTFLRLGDT